MMILKQQDCRNEDSGRPKRAFFRFIEAGHHILVSADWRKSEAWVRIEVDQAYGGPRRLAKIPIELPKSLDEDDARRIAEKAYAAWQMQEVAN